MKLANSTTSSNAIFNITPTGELGLRTSAASFDLGTNAVKIAGNKLHIGTTLVEATATELNYLHGLTPGIVKSETLLMPDLNLDINGLNVISANEIEGTLQTSYQPNITQLDTVDISSISIAGTSLSSTAEQLNYNNVTPGTVVPNKTIIADSFKNISGIETLSTSTIIGTLSTHSQPNITEIGTLGTLKVGKIGIGVDNPQYALDIVDVNPVINIGDSSNSVKLSMDEFGNLKINPTSNIIIQSHKNLQFSGTSEITGLANVSASTITGSLQTPSQLNITELGTLTDLLVSENITVGTSTKNTTVPLSAYNNNGTCLYLEKTETVNCNLGFDIIGDFEINTSGNVKLSSGKTLKMSGPITGVTSIIANSVSGTLQTASQPNITSIGTLGSLSTTGSIGIGTTASSFGLNIVASETIDAMISLNDGTQDVTISLDSLGPIIGSSGNYLSLNQGLGLRFINGGSILGLTNLSVSTITGELQTANQPNITSLGTISNLDSNYIGIGASNNEIYKLHIFENSGKLISFTNDIISGNITITNDELTLNVSNNRLSLGDGVNLVFNNADIIGTNNISAVSISTSTITGELQTTTQSNITSIGTLTSLNVSGPTVFSSTVSDAFIINGGTDFKSNTRIRGSLTVDSNSTLSSLTISSNINATSSMNGGTLTVTGGASFSQDVYFGASIYLGTTELTEASLGGDGGTSTPGIVTDSVFLMPDSSLNLSGFNNLSATNLSGTIQTAYQPNITTIGNLVNLNISDFVGIGTTAPLKPLEINSLSGECLRLSYNKVESANNYVDMIVNDTGNLEINATGGSVITDQLIIGNSINSTMPLEIGYTPFLMTSPYAYNYANNSKGTLSKNTVEYNYSIRALGRILCTQSLDITSDRRLKYNVEELTDEFCTSFIEKNIPVKFNWKNGDCMKSFGYIAQDVIRNGFDEIVNLAQDDKMSEEIEEDGFISPEGIKFTISYQHIIPILAKNQKRLIKENAELKSLVKSLLETFQ